MKDNSKPLVSIRCLVYNHEPYLRKCLDGFVMQKTDFAFEAIVHDDASTDNSAAIIREYAEKYPDIIKPIYETENQYSKKDGSLRNIMNAACNGKYIALCEGDDYWIDSLKLKKQVDFMESHPDFMLCGTNGLIVWENQIQRPSYFNNEIQSEEVSLKDLTSKWFFPTASLFYRREVFENYPEWTKDIYSGDLTLVLIAKYFGKIYYLSDYTCVYRKGLKDSASAIADKSRLYVLQQHKMLYNYYAEFTNGKYSNELKEIISKLESNISYLDLKLHHYFIAWLKHPLRMFKEDVIRRFFYAVLGKEKTHLLFH